MDLAAQLTQGARWEGPAKGLYVSLSRQMGGRDDYRGGQRFIDHQLALYHLSRGHYAKREHYEPA